MFESKKLKRLLAVASLALLALPSAAFAENATKTSTNSAPKLAAVSSNIREDAVRLSQSHFFMGTEEVTVSANGVRIENTSALKFVLVAKAPDWRIYVYRLDDKTYFSESLREFEQNGLMSNFCFPFRPETFTGKPFKIERLKVDGFDVVQLTAKGEKLRYIDIVTVPQEVRHILYVAYKCTNHGGIPVQYWGHVSGVDIVTGMDRKNEIEKRLDTTTIKRVKVSTHEFEVPPGLTAANSMREVVAGNNTRNRDEDMKSLLGL